ncbi:Crp/Fnr family transcriptional regulator [Pelagibius sp. 7325]|uniref:Crp/Fnr family transcriptional regulator n=1 Tax=Pelagibius sp. 7325 TaxID=3131994 RepID=UPI0030EB8678
MALKTEKAHGALGRKLSSVIKLSNAEIDCLEAMQKRVKAVPEGTEFVHDGEPYGYSYIVKQGWAIRFKTLSDGRRQILNFVLPGDFIGLFSPLFEVADHSVAALTDLELHPVEPAFLVDLFGNCPRLGAAVAWCAGRDEAILAEQVVRIGRRSAYERTGHIIVELLHRLRLVDEAGLNSFELPLTQEILADTLGLSIVHVNRTLRRLRENGLLRICGDRVVIEDLEALVSAAEFSPHYLDAQPLPRKTETAISAAAAL